MLATIVAWSVSVLLWLIGSLFLWAVIHNIVSANKLKGGGYRAPFFWWFNDNDN